MVSKNRKNNACLILVVGNPLKMWMHVILWDIILYFFPSLNFIIFHQAF